MLYLWKKLPEGCSHDFGQASLAEAWRVSEETTSTWGVGVKHGIWYKFLYQIWTTPHMQCFKLQILFSYLLEKMQQDISEYNGYDGVHDSAADNCKTHHCGKQRYRTSDILEMHSEGLIMDITS